MKGDLIFGELSSIVFMWVILFLLFLILSICLNQLVKYTFSYKNFFVHTNSLSFRSRNSDDCIEKYKVVSLGSNNALFSFHFQDIIGANWSTGLQTTYENFGVLKKYHGNINECGFVIFTLAPLGTILKTTDFDGIE